MIAGSASSRRVSVRVAALAAGALLMLGGCAAGQDAQTAEESPVVDGVSANVGDIALRAVAVAPPQNNSHPKGGDATLQLVIVNGGGSDDQLTGVSTLAATQVRIFANQQAASPGSPTTISRVNLPAGLAVPFGYSPDQPVIQLHDLTEQLFPAQTIQLTFQFGKAGMVTFTAAVHLAPGPSTTPREDVRPTEN